MVMISASRASRGHLSGCLCAIGTNSYGICLPKQPLHRAEPPAGRDRIAPRKPVNETRLDAAIATRDYLDATRDVLQAHGDLWFQDESFAVTRRR